MALKYSAAEQADDGSHAEATTPFLPDSVSPLSPNSEITSSTMASPASSSTSPLPFVTLAEQTFTPLSLDTGDFDLSNVHNNNAAGKSKSPGVQEAQRLLSRAKSIEQLRRDGNLSRSSSTSTTAPVASAAGRGATLVSARVESFEALQAKNATANLGYELLRTKSQASQGSQRPAGLVSPAPTLSRSPSPSPVGKAPVENVQSTTEPGLGAAEHETAVAARTENTTVPQTTAPTQNPDPPAPTSIASQANDAPELLHPASSAPDCAPTTVAADTTLIRPVPSASQPQERSRATSNPSRPRTASTASLTISHPRPDPNRLSLTGGFLGNIAALEATAERLSMTSSIEDAIREEHNELKRSESRRSSVLQSRARAASTSNQSQLSVDRQNSILGTNSAARTGGYSPGGFVMSPNRSTSAASGRLRSGSKASSIGMPSHIPENADIAGPTGDADHAQEFRFLPRHGPGKASTRSVASKLSLVQIAELEPPSSLTKEVLDEADRAAAAGKRLVEEDDIRASAYQFIEAEFANDVGPTQPVATESHAEPAPRLQLHQPVDYGYQPYQVTPYRPNRRDEERPTTSGSGTTFEQAQAAFGDFDGVHCDPEADRFGPQPEPQDHGSPAWPHAAQAPRATSYIDPATGQHMLYYPAPVPAMLNLPPKLSKKPKAVAQDPRRSLVAGARPRVSRESNVWLPDPTEGLRRSHDDAPFMPEFLGSENGSSLHTAPQPSGTGMEGGAPIQPSHARHTSEATVRTIQPPPETQRETRGPQRLAEAGDRKSHSINADGMPPQLRASAFFDLPPEAHKIEVKDGSAMDTLDSLLDASTKAPVSAFTDHVFAGKLGAEVYGKKKKIKKSATAPEVAPEEKAAKRKTLVKRNSSGNLLGDNAEEKPKRKTLVKRNSAANLLDPNTEKKRASRFSLFGSKHADKNDSDDDDARSARHSAAGDDARSRRSVSPGREAPEADEETEEESEEEEPVYQGPPTTLLAELQLRKQQNKMRTRPPQQAYPEGMRSTLLELEAVAEVERKARLGKRVTLAWEDPAAAAHPESDDDEEVPLGVLYAAKAAGAANPSTMDISAIMSEVHRPLGLMERREMEENEPLSRRRDRLQGKVTQTLPTPLTALQKRLSHMPTTNRFTLPVPPGGRSRPGSIAGDNNNNNPNTEESEPEHEGETLAARKARLAAENPLPRARPVSAAFSSELLSVLGVDEDATSKGKTPAHSRNVSTISALGKENTPPGPVVPEEEETLGQRRARLQREREAREREMAFSTLNRAATPLGLTPNASLKNIFPNRTSLRPSTGTGPMPMADVLGAATRPMTMTSMMDPREQERLRREAEAARHRRETEAKMALLRAQMPTTLSRTSVGAPTGGYMGGRFNDGLGGTGLQSGLGYPMSGGQQRGSTLLGGGGGLVGAAGAYGGSTPNLLAVPGVYPSGGLAASMSVSALPLQQGNAALGGGAGQAGHMDMVERWRRGVMP